MEKCRVILALQGDARPEVLSMAIILNTIAIPMISQ
jgi:hypothetical protein